jgi:hypothetical protein
MTPKEELKNFRFNGLKGYKDNPLYVPPTYEK